MKETQAINKSLSALGDVIASLGARGGGAGNGEGHVPYRNSKVSSLPLSFLVQDPHFPLDNVT
jgi:kinesin family protein C1